MPDHFTVKSISPDNKYNPFSYTEERSRDDFKYGLYGKYQHLKNLKVSQDVFPKDLIFKQKLKPFLSMKK